MLLWQNIEGKKQDQTQRPFHKILLLFSHVQPFCFALNNLAASQAGLRFTMQSFQVYLEHQTHLPQPSKCYDYRFAITCLGIQHIQPYPIIQDILENKQAELSLLCKFLLEYKPVNQMKSFGTMLRLYGWQIHVRKHAQQHNDRISFKTSMYPIQSHQASIRMIKRKIVMTNVTEDKKQLEH